MATTRNSKTKKSPSIVNESSPPDTVLVEPSTNIQDTTTVMSSFVQTDHYATLLESIRANQVTIQTLMTKLDTNSILLDGTSKKLLTLYDQVQSLQSTVLDTMPKELNATLEVVKQDLRLDVSTSITNLSTKIYQDIRTHQTESLQCFKTQAIGISHITTEIADLSKTLSTIQDTSLSKLDVEQIVVSKWQDELDPHIQSHYDLQKDVNDRFSTLDQTIQSTIDTALHNHPVILRLTSSSPTATPVHPRPPASSSIGFYQLDSKDFSVSKLQKELKDIKLSGDTLKELEVFWDAILRAFTNLCKTQAYPYYRDLCPTFDFKLHLVCDPKNFRCSQHEFDQGLHNYRSFGDVLRIFLHTNPTITEDNSPKAYLRLLSMCDLRDGFQILQELVFSLSPQLSGDYYDFRIDIGNITIQPGEHLSKFYQRVIQLSTEITLANIPNGGLTELAIRYLTLL